MSASRGSSFDTQGMGADAPFLRQEGQNQDSTSAYDATGSGLSGGGNLADPLSELIASSSSSSSLRRSGMAGSSSTSSSLASSPTPASQMLRVRRKTIVPGWAVPPRVLLVDDDAVNRTLSSKFLKVFGCTIDVAVDGEGAVQKMNFGKYDLVLMISRRLLSSFYRRGR